jgi:hypothetical protein
LKIHLVTANSLYCFTVNKKGLNLEVQPFAISGFYKLTMYWLWEFLLLLLFPIYLFL